MGDLLELVEGVKSLPSGNKVVLQGYHVQVIETWLEIDLTDTILTHCQTLEDRERPETNQFVPGVYPVLLQIQKFQVLEMILRNLILSRHMPAVTTNQMQLLHIHKGWGKYINLTPI